MILGTIKKLFLRESAGQVVAASPAEATSISRRKFFSFFGTGVAMLAAPDLFPTKPEFVAAIDPMALWLTVEARVGERLFFQMLMDPSAELLPNVPSAADGQAPCVAVGPLVAASVVDPPQLEPRIEERLALDEGLDLLAASGGEVEACELLDFRDDRHGIGRCVDGASGPGHRAPMACRVAGRRTACGGRAERMTAAPHRCASDRRRSGRAA